MITRSFWLINSGVVFKVSVMVVSMIWSKLTESQKLEFNLDIILVLSLLRFGLYDAAILALVGRKHKSIYTGISAKNNTRKLCNLL